MAFKKIKFLYHEAFTMDAGVAILDPTYHNYEDAFADGYVKAIMYEWSQDEGCYVISKPVFSRLHEDKNGSLYFYKFRVKCYLDNMTRCNDISDFIAYARIRK